MGIKLARLSVSRNALPCCTETWVNIEESCLHPPKSGLGDYADLVMETDGVVGDVLDASMER